MYGSRHSRAEPSLVKGQLRQNTIFFVSSVPQCRQNGKQRSCGQAVKKKGGFSRTFQTFPAKGKFSAKHPLDIAATFVTKTASVLALQITPQTHEGRHHESCQNLSSSSKGESGLFSTGNYPNWHSLTMSDNLRNFRPEG